MADNRNEGWRGRFGWGESGGARGAFGEQRHDNERYDDTRFGREDAVDYNDRRSLGGYGPEHDRYADGGGRGGGGRGRGWTSGLRAGGQSDRYEDYAGRAGYSDDRGSDYAGGRYRAGGRPYSDAPYPYGSRGDEPGRDHGYRGRGGYADAGRRAVEDRSFGDHNAYVEAVADGSTAPGEHRGRGPKGYRRSDDRIREDINDRLTDDSWVDATHIDVQVADGEVTLTGSVNSRDAKRRAEDIAERVSGVEDVQNNLKVDRSGSINDQTAVSSSTPTPSI